MIKITVKGLDEYIARLDPGRLTTILRRGLFAAASHVKDNVAQYPEGNPHRPVDTSQWTDKQRRGYFAKLHSGEIEVPYRRGQSNKSENLGQKGQKGQKWTIAARNGGLTQIVGTNVSYAELVIGAKQTAYHAETGWRTIYAVAEKEAPRVEQIVVAELEASL